MKKICIVTTRHISYNPRVLKEADAFFGRGYSVSVITVNNHFGQHQFDRELMASRQWTLKTVDFRKEIKAEKGYWLRLSVVQKLYMLLSRLTLGFGIAERAALKGFDALQRLAKQEGADFYLAHHAEALGVAYKAAKANGAGFGFDAEDFHSGMSENGQTSREDELIAYLEAKYLPHCSYLTAASKGIGEAYADKYKVPLRNTILNVFPKEKIAGTAVNTPLRFYWYSQVIGPNRSLETLMQAAARVNHPFEIHLRGSFHSQEYKTKLEAMVQREGLQTKVFFHPPILAENINKDAAKYDVGLALESDISFNRNICVTNKIFSYLMSGLAIIGTDTYGQKDIFEQFPDVVRLCRQNNSGELAAAMTFFIEHPEQVLAAKKAARKAADQRFNWEVESERLLAGFEKSLNQKRKPQSVVQQEG